MYESHLQPINYMTTWLQQQGWLYDFSWQVLSVVMKPHSMSVSLDIKSAFLKYNLLNFNNKCVWIIQNKLNEQQVHLLEHTHNIHTIRTQTYVRRDTKLVGCVATSRDCVYEFHTFDGLASSRSHWLAFIERQMTQGHIFCYRFPLKSYGQISPVIY